MKLCACFIPLWMCEPVSSGPNLPRSCVLVLFLHGCESLFRMGCICHKVVCLFRSFVDVRACFEWAVSALKCMLVSFLHGCESLFRMDRICHEVVCLSRSFVDVRACFEWAVSAMKLYTCLIPSWIWEPVSKPI